MEAALAVRTRVGSGEREAYCFSIQQARAWRRSSTLQTSSWDFLAVAHPGTQLLSGHPIFLPRIERTDDERSENYCHANSSAFLPIPSSLLVIHRQVRSASQGYIRNILTRYLQYYFFNRDSRHHA